MTAKEYYRYRYEKETRPLYKRIWGCKLINEIRRLENGKDIQTKRIPNK